MTPGAEALAWRPLSPAQLSIWRAEMLHRHTPRWNQVTVIRLRGAIDPDRLEAAVNAIVTRHPALRTRLRRHERQGWQAFAAPTPFHLERHDLPTAPAERDRAVEAGSERAAAHRFPLLGGPLFRAELLLLAPDDAALILSLHHIAADGVALALLVPQIAACCAGEATGEPDSAYERWLDRHAGPATAPDLNAALAFYARELAGATARYDALYDSVADRPSDDPPGLVEVTCTLDAAVCDGLRTLARRSKATLFIVLMAAYGAVLRAETGSTDLVLATFVSGRAGEAEPVVGSCINTMLVRLRLAGCAAEGELIAAAKESWRPVRQYQSAPLALLSEAARGALPTPQFAINFLDMNDAPFQAPGLTASVTHAQQGFPLNDLLLYALREQDSRLRLRLIVGSGTPRISQPRVAAMLTALAGLLRDWSGTVSGAVPAGMAAASVRGVEA